jgi:hypothetical protein
MSQHRCCGRTADLRASTGLIAVLRPALKTCKRIVSAIRGGFALQRFRAQCREERTAEGNSAQNTTARRRDKSACHAGRQVADATRLSSGRPVGRWQVSANPHGFTRLRPAHYVLAAAVRLGEASR